MVGFSVTVLMCAGLYGGAPLTRASETKVSRKDSEESTYSIISKVKKGEERGRKGGKERQQVMKTRS